MSFEKYNIKKNKVQNKVEYEIEHIMVDYCYTKFRV